ncbi:MAG: asparaginase domain-containing protein [Gordonia sp. (in: high G+C Gram-positive bacteria)]|uniref:asparaginase domain-containing protein n=1 Tax=Gordonia sp. (in: high G+C Gram-positive bacteria) TaxID=84139 RepID=UPI003BB66C42
MNSRQVVMITTGGTAASQTTQDGAVPVLTGADLIPSGLSTVPVRTMDVLNLDSSAMTVRDQFTVCSAIAAARSDDAVAGIVVIHGTDTLEETAFLADVFAADPRPVVFTGAQHPADDPRSDGPANIAAAIALAADPSNQGNGVQVALGGRVLPARGCFKVSTVAPEAFDTVHPALPRPLIANSVPGGRPARVDLLALYPGVSPGLIAAAIAQRAAGIVLTATGSGNTHPDITAEVAHAKQRNVPVVVSTRVPYGEVVATYGGGGGGVDLARAGAIISPWLRAPQARMALLALLTAGASRSEIEDFFRAAQPH